MKKKEKEKEEENGRIRGKERKGMEEECFFNSKALEVVEIEGYIRRQYRSGR